MIQTLRNAGVNTESIMEKSGHKNMSSVLNYSIVTDEEQKKCQQSSWETRVFVLSARVSDRIKEDQVSGSPISAAPSYLR